MNARTLELMAGLHASIRPLCERHIEKCESLGILVTLTQGLRTFEEQRKLWEQGRSTEGPIVTHARPGFSWHNWGRAYDLAILTFPGDPTPDDVYDGPCATVGQLGEDTGLLWGGRWKHPDADHFELPAGSLAHMV